MATEMPEALEYVRLHYGVTLDGETHVDVDLGPLSVADYFVLEPERKVVPEGDELSAYQYTLRVLSRRIRRLGSVPRGRITGDFLREQLQMPDAMLLVERMGRLDRRLESFRDADG